MTRSIVGTADDARHVHLVPRVPQSAAEQLHDALESTEGAGSEEVQNHQRGTPASWGTGECRGIAGRRRIASAIARATIAAPAGV